MQQKRKPNGKFDGDGNPKQLISLKVPSEVRDKLKLQANASQFMLDAILEKFVVVQPLPDDEWEYYQVWHTLHQLREKVNHCIFIISQYEEKSQAADEAIALLKSQISKWME